MKPEFVDLNELINNGISPMDELRKGRVGYSQQLPVYPSAFSIFQGQ